MPTSSPVRTAPLTLWRIAERFMHTLLCLFGAPEAIAAQHTLTQKQYTLLLSWLRAGEALIRNLLLIEAAAYVSGAAPAVPRRGARRPRQRKLMTFSAEHPEAWRVSFRCFTARARAAQYAKPATRAEPRRFYSAWPLAERIEAMLRAFENPEPFAKRMAQRLSVQPKRVRDVRAYPVGAAALIGHEDVLTIERHGDLAERRITDTS